MKAPVNRRDFLRIAGLLPLGVATPHWMRRLSVPAAASAGEKNVIIVVLDAFSAYNISLFGYRRETAPNFVRLAKRAIVYYNHFAGSNFTTSGTATLLTGTLPWTHRAIEDDGTVADALVKHNIFNVFQGYHRIAFTHNSWVFTLLNQFGHDLEELIPRAKLFLESYNGFVDTLFFRDDDAATVSWARDIKLQDGYSYSLFLSHLYNLLRSTESAQFAAEFPLGIPVDGGSNTFTLEQATTWLQDHLRIIPQPFLAYFHYLPPHAPYRTSIEFYHHFAHDDLKPIEKPIDVFAYPGASNDSLSERTQYDEFILYADKAFGDLFDSLEKSGLLENSWVVLTSDHGEMFERGIIGHGNPTLYQPVIRVPLLIFEPGRQVGTDIYTTTSAADLLPTLAHVTGRPVPDWTEGMVLPPFAASGASSGQASGRNIYAVYARKNGQFAPLIHASTTLIKDRYKLIYSTGYPGIPAEGLVKLYDIQADPEELVDLIDTQNGVATELLGELKSKLAQVNQPYL